jgi:hypothetical protein
MISVSHHANTVGGPAGPTEIKISDRNDIKSREETRIADGQLNVRKLSVRN